MVTTNNKDVAAKSIGDAFSFPAGKSAKLEFDLTIDAWGGTHSGPAVLVDIKRYESKTAETRSVLIGERCASFAGWNYDGGMPAENWPAGEKTYADEVKLDSFKAEDHLAPKIWKGMMLNSKVRLKLLDIADDFWDTCNLGWVKLRGIHLTGSICNFNWSK